MIVSVLITLVFFHHFYFMVFLYTAHDHVYTLVLTFIPSVYYMEHNSKHKDSNSAERVLTPGSSLLTIL